MKWISIAIIFLLAFAACSWAQEVSAESGSTAQESTPQIPELSSLPTSLLWQIGSDALQKFADKLADARRDSVRGAEIAARLNELVARNASYIATARNENERTVAQLRLAIAVYDILRQYYDPSYKAAGSADKKQGN
jgi:hypothetical protein